MCVCFEFVYSTCFAILDVACLDIRSIPKVLLQLLQRKVAPRVRLRYLDLDVLRLTWISRGYASSGICTLMSPTSHRKKSKRTEEVRHGETGSNGFPFLLALVMPLHEL